MRVPGAKLVTPVLEPDIERISFERIDPVLGLTLGIIPKNRPSSSGVPHHQSGGSKQGDERGFACVVGADENGESSERNSESCEPFEVLNLKALNHETRIGLCCFGAQSQQVHPLAAGRILTLSVATSGILSSGVRR